MKSIITKPCQCHRQRFLALKFENFHLKIFDIFLIFAQNIDFGSKIRKVTENFGVHLCYVADRRLRTLYRHAANVQRAPHTRLGYVTEAISRKIGTRM